MFVVHQNIDIATEIKDIYYDSIWRDEPKTELLWVIYINGINYGEFHSKEDVQEEYNNVIYALRQEYRVYQVGERKSGK